MNDDTGQFVEFWKAPHCGAIDTPGSPHARRNDLFMAACLGMAPVASGVGLGLCFSEPAMRWLAWIALVPLAWLLVAKRRRGMLVGVFVGAVVCHLMGLDFVRQAYSGTAASAWITLSVIASLPWIAAVLVGRVLQRRFDLPMSVALPLVWVTMEFARMYFVGLFMEVPAPYVQLGAALVEYEHLVQVADLGGVWGLSWMVAAVNGALFDVLLAACRRDRSIVRRAVISVAIALGLTASAWLYGAWRLSQASSVPGPIVALVPGSLRTALDGDGVENLMRRTRRILGDEWPALFVWSEGACPFPVVTESPPGRQDSRIRLHHLSQALDSSVLVGCDRHEIVRDDPVMRQYNSVAFASSEGGFQGCYDKRYLVPWTEFQPLAAVNLGLLPAPPSHPAYAGPYRPGSRYVTFALTDGDQSYEIACSICFEVSYAVLHRRLAAGAAGDVPAFFVGVASESAFEGPLYAQVSADAQRLRAIECRRAFVRIASHGTSSFVDGNGQVLVEQHTTAESPVLAEAVPIDDRFSLYVACGDWLPVLSSCVLGLLVAAGLFRTRRCRAAARGVD